MVWRRDRRFGRDLRFAASTDHILDAPEANDVAEHEVRAQLFRTVDENAVGAPQIVDAEMPILAHDDKGVQARQTGVVHRHVRLATPPDRLRLAGLQINRVKIRRWDLK